MKFESTRDFRRGRVQVLAQFRDPARFETVLGDMGATTERRSDPPAASWACAMTWRDAPRAFQVAIAETVADETMTISVGSDLADAAVTCEFYDLPDGGCRVIARAELASRSLGSKVLMQSLRVMRGTLEDRLGRFVMLMGRR